MPTSIRRETTPSRKLFGQQPLGGGGGAGQERIDVGANLYPRNDEDAKREKNQPSRNRPALKNGFMNRPC